MFLICEESNQRTMARNEVRGGKGTRGKGETRRGAEVDGVQGSNKESGHKDQGRRIKLAKTGAREVKITGQLERKRLEARREKNRE